VHQSSYYCIIVRCSAVLMDPKQMVQNNFPLGHSLIVQYVDSYCDIWVGRVKYLTSADWRRISMTNLCFPSIFTNCIGQLLLWHARRENKQVWTDRVALVRSSYLNQHCYNNNPPLINFAPKDVASLAEVAVRIWRYKLRVQRTWLEMLTKVALFGYQQLIAVN